MHTRLILGLVLLTAASAIKADGDNLSASRVFELASPSIVVVEAHDKEGVMVARGSGVVIANGVVVSNCHVFTKADTATVRYDQTNFPAALQYGDTAHDLCSFTVNGLPAPPVRMSSTPSLKVGQPAFAIGAPEGLELTLSGGLISSLRKLPDGVVIQMTTPISPGSSGGGLFDGQARLIGITSYYMGEGQQLNFALPVEWINELPQRGKLKAITNQTLEHAGSTATTTDALSEGRRALLTGDYVRALAILEPLAEQGNTSAQSGLGAMYGAGVGVGQDWSKAMQWYRDAANQGNAFAQNALGDGYYSGKGVPQDYEQAATWYLKAATQENAEAQNALGMMYQLGQGVPKNAVLAYAFYNLSATTDSSDRNPAVANRNAVVGSMSTATIQAAQERTRDMIQFGVPIALGNTRPPNKASTSLWNTYFGQIVRQNMQGMTAPQPYAYLVKAPVDSSARAQNERLLRNIQDVGTRGALPGNMFAFAGPDSAATADLMVTAFKDAPPRSFGGVIILFIGDQNDAARVRRVVVMSGATFRFAEMK